MTISSPFGVLHAVLDGAGYQFPGFSQKPGAANMPTNEPLTMTWTQQSWRPDFKKASALGVEGTFWRASNAEEMDPTYPAAVESAIAAGQKHTGYGYLRNDRLPATEGAKVFLEALKQAPPPTLRPMADVEDFTGQEKWTPRAKADYIHTWMGVVGDAFGVAPVLYGPAWWLDRELGPLAAEMDRYEVMLSHYIHHGQVPPSQHTEWYKWCSTTQNGDAGIAWGRSAQGVLSREGWQFTSEGKGPDFGVASTWVDLNMVTDAAWNRWLIASAMPPPPNTIRVPRPSRSSSGLRTSATSWPGSSTCSSPGRARSESGCPASSPRRWTSRSAGSRAVAA